MRTTVLITLIAVLILGAPGCVQMMFAGDIPIRPTSAADGAPAPGSRAYDHAVVLGFVGDTLLIPLFGVGILMWIWDAMYLWVWKGGYAARWHVAHAFSEDKRE